MPKTLKLWKLTFYLLYYILNDKNYETRPEEKHKVDFKCKIADCSASRQAPIGEFTNLNKHMLDHDETKAWYKQYMSSQKCRKEPPLSNDMLNLVRFFITTNSSTLSFFQGMRC